MDMNSTKDNVMAHEARTDLQERLLLATPQHTTRGFLFSALLRVVRELGGDEAVVQHCLAASGEKSFVDFFNYPTRSLLLLLSDAAQQLSGKHHVGGAQAVAQKLGVKNVDIHARKTGGLSIELVVSW
ncbi:DUF2378 family protein [Archangium sp.]|uniref:DUF2378 family protein n=1 Tax=Archangium sp. TaxID=1872627 RepID=UPI00286CFC30|nr:DUF2378 family protein [Archangium sp.]